MIVVEIGEPWVNIILHTCALIWFLLTFASEDALPRAA